MDASLSFLLDNLEQVTKYHHNLISAVAGELKALCGVLEPMKSILKDVSKRQKKEVAFTAYEKQIRQVVYYVEDTIDSVITQLATKTVIARTLSTHTLAKEIKFLREVRVVPVFNPAKNHFDDLITHITDQSDEQELEQPRLKGAVMTRQVVGREDETRTIIKYLNQKSNGLGVISITGMGGIGKTTLAWKICHEPDILFEFQVIIWVTMSATLKRDVFLTILNQFTQLNDRYSKMTDEELAMLVRKRLDREKFFIVLDDLCELVAWNQIKEVLPMHNGMSKVLITTRILEVALRVNPTHEPILVPDLSHQESNSLLQHEVFHALDVEGDLAKIGSIIAMNCKGLPLMVVMIAGILRYKVAIAGGSTKLISEEWEKVSKSIENHASEEKGSLLPQVIRLSYNKLPYDLRDCFLYLGLFPEDAIISASQLTQLWIAEGFIQPKPGESLEDIARDNLNELIYRNLVIVQTTKLNGEVKTCSVHDLVHAFCEKEAGVENGNIFQEIRKNEIERVFEPDLNYLKQCRRLSVHSHVHNFFSQKPMIPATRSFLCFPKEPVDLTLNDIATVNKAFSLLRVFAAQQIKFSKFPTGFTGLIHLRYLTLSVAYQLKILPEAIFHLWNLRTLIVETLSRTLEIKADIWKLMQLRHFKTKASIFLSPSNGKGIGGENLTTIGRLSPESCTDSFITKAKNLNALAIHGDLSNLLSEFNNLQRLHSLNKLKLEHDAYKNPLPSLPEPHKFPQNLKFLTLTGTYLDWEKMSTVGKLERLEMLKLKGNAFMGSTWDVDGGFQNLKFLYIEDTDLADWKISNHAFPMLKSLTLKRCGALREIPCALENTLNVLVLDCVAQSVVESATKIEKQELKVEFKVVHGA